MSSESDEKPNTVPFPSATPSLRRQLSALSTLSPDTIGYSYQDAYHSLRIASDAGRPIRRSTRHRRSIPSSTYSYRFGSLAQKLSPVTEESDDRSRSARRRASSVYEAYAAPWRHSRTMGPTVLIPEDPFLEEVTFAYLAMRPSPSTEARKAQVMRRAKESKRRGPLKRAVGATGRAIASVYNSIQCPPLRRYWVL